MSSDHPTERAIRELNAQGYSFRHTGREDCCGDTYEMTTPTGEVRQTDWYSIQEKAKQVRDEISRCHCCGHRHHPH